MTEHTVPHSSRKRYKLARTYSLPLAVAAATSGALVLTQLHPLRPHVASAAAGASITVAAPQPAVVPPTDGVTAAQALLPLCLDKPGHDSGAVADWAVLASTQAVVYRPQLTATLIDKATGISREAITKPAGQMTVTHLVASNSKTSEVVTCVGGSDLTGKPQTMLVQFDAIPVSAEESGDVVMLSSMSGERETFVSGLAPADATEIVLRRGTATVHTTVTNRAFVAVVPGKPDEYTIAAMSAAQELGAPRTILRR